MPQGAKTTKPGWFHGVLVGLPLASRIFNFGFLVLLATGLCFSQLGILWLNDQLSDSINLVVLLAPIMIAAVLLGFVPGVLVGLLTGVILMARAMWTPTSYFDLYLTDWELSVLPVLIGSILMSAVVIAVLRTWPVRGDAGLAWRARISPLTAIGIIVAGFLLASCFSLGARGGIFIFISGYFDSFESGLTYFRELVLSFSSVAEMAINTVFLAMVGIGAALFGTTYRVSAQSSLGYVFMRNLLLAVVTVFMLASAASFGIETFKANTATAKSLESQLDYLEGQVNNRIERRSLLVDMLRQTMIEKAQAAAEFIAADPSLLSDQRRFTDFAEMLGLASIAVTDGKGVIVADSEYGGQAVGFDFSSTESTAPYLSVIDGGAPLFEEPRISIDPTGKPSDEHRVFCGVSRTDEPGIVQISISSDAYEEYIKAASLDDLVDDYQIENDGIVILSEGAQCISSNSPLYDGKDLLDTFAVSEEGLEAFSKAAEEPFTAFDDTLGYTVVTQSRQVGGYFLFVMEPLPATYVERTSALMYNTVLFLVLFGLIYALTARLLRNVVLEPITRTNETLGRITEGDLYARVNVHNVKEFSSLSQGINTMVDALKDSIEEAEQRNAQELATAKVIQESALPSEFPPFPDIDRFDIFASMKTAREVGGDFYDLFLVDEDRLGFVVADVSGKGIPAALFMMSAKTQVRLYMESGSPLDKAISSANHHLCLGNEESMFVTLFACLLNFRTGELAYVNAGHNPPAICHAGEWGWVRDISGMPLGIFDGFSYEAFSRQLDEGDLLYLYTDGVTEAMSVDGELFGEDRLGHSLRACEHMNARSLVAGVRCAVADFTVDAEQSDDITMLALRYGVPPEQRAMIVIPAVDTQLENLTGIVHEELTRHHAPKSVYNPIDIALEELFVNVCRYAYPDATPDNPGTARIGFSYEPSPPALTIQIIDDGIPYNPLEKPDTVLPDNVMDMPIGGLGIMLAKQCVDEMLYEHDGTSNILTITKRW